MNVDAKYMRRALELARKGYPTAFPNPMVGAVIVDPEGKIIGEGYHRRCGEAHAEVNAVASVADKDALRQATMYVTLEPCAHYGRTGPCAKLIIDAGIPNVVVGCRDPFEKVDGKGIEMLLDAGVNVEVGILEEECKRLNAMFFTAHTLKRPFIILKWAQTADGYIDVKREAERPALKVSSALTTVLTHGIRAICDGILVGSETIIKDDPTLLNRLFPGKSPRPIILDRRRRITSDYKILDRDPIILTDDIPLDEAMHKLYAEGISSILVEGGARVLTSFIESGLWDLARVEISPQIVGDEGAAHAPTIDEKYLIKTACYESQIVKYYSKNPLIDVKNI